MKIAVASNKNSIEGSISEKAGRAPFFIIFEDKEVVEVMKNHFALGGGGAGFSVAKLLQEKGVDKVFGKKLGDNMKSALEERKIEYFETDKDLVKEIIE